MSTRDHVHDKNVLDLLLSKVVDAHAQSPSFHGQEIQRRANNEMLRFECLTWFVMLYKVIPGLEC